MGQERKLNCGTSSGGSSWWIRPLAWSKNTMHMCDYLATGCFALIKRKCHYLKYLQIFIAQYFCSRISHICCKTNKDLGLSSTTLPPPSSRCKAQSCRCKRAHSNTRKPMKNIKRYLLNMAYLNSFKIKTKQNNSKRPVDALAETHISPTDN